jgi:signal peptidase I
MSAPSPSDRPKTGRWIPRSLLALGGAGGLVVLAVLALVLVRLFWIEPYRVPAASMVPELPIGQFFLAEKRLGAVSRGDVLVFEYPPDPSVDYVKRVIGLPGEQVEVRDNLVYIDDRPLVRHLIDEFIWHDQDCMDQQALRYEEGDDARSWQIIQSPGGPSRLSNFGPVRIPADHYFMLGDNRDNSSDSRAWGMVPADHLLGRASHLMVHRDPCPGS